MKKEKKVKKSKEIAIVKEDNKKIELRAVLFTDGSTYPTNPGKSGSGIHGYTYNHFEKPDKAKKFGKYVVTNKLCIFMKFYMTIFIRNYSYFSSFLYFFIK